MKLEEPKTMCYTVIKYYKLLDLLNRQFMTKEELLSVSK